MNDKTLVTGMSLLLLLFFLGIILAGTHHHPQGFNASNISPERVQKLYRSNPPETVKELLEIVEALHKYSKTNNSYPKSLYDAQLGFILTSYKNAKRKHHWIEGLVPTFLPSLPESDIPQAPHEATFIYRSNGGYFMILARNPEDCLWVRKFFNELLYDSTGECLGYGIWTSRAMLWKKE